MPPAVRQPSRTGTGSTAGSGRSAGSGPQRTKAELAVMRDRRKAVGMQWESRADHRPVWAMDEDQLGAYRQAVVSFWADYPDQIGTWPFEEVRYLGDRARMLWLAWTQHPRAGNMEPASTCKTDDDVKNGVFYDVPERHPLFDGLSGRSVSPPLRSSRTPRPSSKPPPARREAA
ncbi:hypothetical protein CALCODRAFT_488534, partial [Calocera cornea HHB12733]